MSTLPQNLLLSLQSAFGSLTDVRAVGGGDTSPAVSARTERAGRVFIKYSDGAAGGTYAAEADGLAALRSAVAAMGLEERLIVPEPLAVSTTEETRAAYLVLPWLERAAASSADWAGFGESLALLHGVRSFGESSTTQEAIGGFDEGPAARDDSASFAESGGLPPRDGNPNARSKYGWPHHNYLGPETQVNTPSDSWPDFYRERRLRAMAARMRERDRWLPKWDAMLDTLSRKLPDLLPGAPPPALLHGDLWGGNAMPLPDGRFALIDPAVYRGHHEVDLAMTELFGGFPQAFYNGYYAVKPQAAEYTERRDLYQLYYLIMHLGLSMSYGIRVEAILRRHA